MARRKKASFGQTLLAAAGEAVGIEKGKLSPGRVTRYKAASARIDRPPRYGAKRIRRIRVNMDCASRLVAKPSKGISL